MTLPTLSANPLFGSLFQFRNDRIGLQRRLVSECGDLGWVRIGPVRILALNSAALAHELLTDHADSFVKSAGIGRFARPLLGDGLLTSENEKHRRQRRLIAPAFQHRRIASYAKVMADYAERTVGTWQEGARIDLSEELMRLTLAIVGKTLFDADVDDDEAAGIGEALTVSMEYVTREVTQLVHWPIAWPVPRNLRYRRAIARLDETVYRIIRARRAAGVDRGDVLSMLLLARDEEDGSQMTDEQIRDEAMTLLLAGHETTANALAWAGMLLAEHPALFERLAREADDALVGRTPTVDDLAKLPFALQVFKESMRLYPPAYLTGRRAIRDVTVGGHRITEGTTVFVNIFGIHHRGDYFPDPERFDPDRFLPAAEKALPKSAFLPFGAGPRICVGNHFALMEGQLILATLAQRVRLERDSTGTIAPEPLITLRPRGGVPMRVHWRTHHAQARARGSEESAQSRSA